MSPLMSHEQISSLFGWPFCVEFGLNAEFRVAMHQYHEGCLGLVFFVDFFGFVKRMFFWAVAFIESQKKILSWVNQTVV